MWVFCFGVFFVFFFCFLFVCCFFFVFFGGGWGVNTSWKDCNLTDMIFLLTSVIHFFLTNGLQLQYTIIFNLRKIHSLGHISDDARFGLSLNGSETLVSHFNFSKPRSYNSVASILFCIVTWKNKYKSFLLLYTSLFLIVFPL